MYSLLILDFTNFGLCVNVVIELKIRGRRFILRRDWVTRQPVAIPHDTIKIFVKKKIDVCPLLYDGPDMLMHRRIFEKNNLYKQKKKKICWSYCGWLAAVPVIYIFI